MNIAVLCEAYSWGVWASCFDSRPRLRTFCAPYILGIYSLTVIEMSGHCVWV